MLGLTQFQGTWNNVLTRTAHCHPPLNNPSHNNPSYGADLNLKSLRDARGKPPKFSINLEFDFGSAGFPMGAEAETRRERVEAKASDEIKRPTAARVIMELAQP